MAEKRMTEDEWALFTSAYDDAVEFYRTEGEKKICRGLDRIRGKICAAVSPRPGGLRCPLDGTEMSLAEYPDTGTSVDCYEAKCGAGHVWEASVELQTGEWALRLITSTEGARKVDKGGESVEKGEKTSEKLFWLTPENIARIQEKLGMSPEGDRVPVSLNRKERGAAETLGIKLEEARLG